MARVLYITANPKTEEQSYCLTVGKAFLDAYRKEKPQDEIVELDLYQIEIPMIDSDVFSGWGKLQQGQAFEELSDGEKAKVAGISELTEQFITFDKYVIVNPFWNFSIPAKLKAYIDSICIAGKTFKHSANGPIGLLKGRKALHIEARGGIYSEGPMNAVEFSDRYLRAIFDFIGITDVATVLAEGMAYMPEKAEQIKEEAIIRARQAAIEFAKEPVQV